MVLYSTTPQRSNLESSSFIWGNNLKLGKGAKMTKLSRGKIGRMSKTRDKVTLGN